MPRMNLAQFDFDNDDSVTFEPIRKSTDPVNDGHAWKRGAENARNRAVRQARQFKENLRGGYNDE